MGAARLVPGLRGCPQLLIYSLLLWSNDQVQLVDLFRFQVVASHGQVAPEIREGLGHGIGHEDLHPERADSARSVGSLPQTFQAVLRYIATSIGANALKDAGEF